MKRVVAGCIKPRMWIGVTALPEKVFQGAPFISSKISPHTRSPWLHASFTDYKKWWFPPKSAQTPGCGKMYSSCRWGRCWHTSHRLEVLHTHLHQSLCPKPMEGDEVAHRRGMQPSPSPHRAAEVRDWELVLLRRIRANTDRQTFNERRHAAFNLMTVSTHREYLSPENILLQRIFFSSTTWDMGVRRGCPGGWDGPGSGGRDCRGKRDGKMWETVSSFSYTPVHCIGK